MSFCSCYYDDVNCVSSILSKEVYIRIIAWVTWGDWVGLVQSNAYLLFVQWCLSELFSIGFVALRSFYLVVESRACILRFKDCPLCGADIETTEADSNLQSTVDRFIEGHGRIKRSHVENADKEELSEKKTVIYEDVSLERGDFLLQQAMRVGL